jgi:hypothetical protein
MREWPMSYRTYRPPRPRPNTNSKHDPKHHQETLARVDTEAGDANEVKYLQSWLPSDQVLAEADAKTSRHLNEARTADKQIPLPHNA